MTQIIIEIEKYLDIYYLIAFMALAYMFKGLILEIIISLSKVDLSKSKLAKNLIVFFIATLCAVPFYTFFNHDKMKLFVTFCVGTSTHDLLIKTLNAAFKKIISDFLKIKNNDTN